MEKDNTEGYVLDVSSVEYLLLGEKGGRVKVRQI